MGAAPELSLQETRHQVREAGINPDFWYPVCWAEQLKSGKILPVVVWQQRIVVFRDQGGSLAALADACLHKGVELHKGDIEGERIVCPYHGWEFDHQGQCQRIPYLPEGKRCPSQRIKSYPVQEAYGIVWVFPGRSDLADQTPLPEVPEYADDDWLLIPISGHFHAHFSICNENTMDVFHGHLHKDLQGWFDPVLTQLERTETEVFAEYRVSYKGRMAKLLGLAKSADEVCHRHVSIEYRYPHYRNSMGKLSSLYLMRLPVGPNETRSFSLMFLKLGLPRWLWHPIRKPVAKVLWHLLLKRFLDQDKEMMESEQYTYELDRSVRRMEINPAIVALQRVIQGQYQTFQQVRESEQS